MEPQIMINSMIEQHVQANSREKFKFPHRQAFMMVPLREEQ